MSKVSGFKLTLYVVQPQADLNGIEALDFRRFWKLPEDVTWQRHYHRDDAYSITWSVDEQFARCFFRKHLVETKVPVLLAWLSPEEVRPATTAGTGLVLRDGAIDTARAIQLYWASRLHFQQEEVKDLENEIVVLRDELADIQKRTGVDADADAEGK